MCCRQLHGGSEGCDLFVPSARVLIMYNYTVNYYLISGIKYTEKLK